MWGRQKEHQTYLGYPREEISDSFQIVWKVGNRLIDALRFIGGKQSSPTGVSRLDQIGIVSRFTGTFRLEDDPVFTHTSPESF